MQGFSLTSRWAGVTLLACGWANAPLAAGDLFLPAPIDRPRATAIADFNADGNQDLAVTHSLTNQVWILFGDGSGQFSPSTASPVTTPVLPVSVAAAPLPGADFFDTDPDLVMAVVGNVGLISPLGGSIPAVRVYPGVVVAGSCSGGANDTLDCTRGVECPGGSCLGAEVEFPLELQTDLLVGDSPNSLILADFTGDSVADMAFSVAGMNRVTVLVGNADGTFSAGSNPETGQDCDSSPAGQVAAIGVDPLVAGDWDGNGTIDLAVANTRDSTVSLLAGRGDANFDPAGCLDPCPGCRAPTAIATADLDLDQLPDLALAYFGETCAGGDLNASQVCTSDGDCHATAACDLADLNGGAACTDPTTSSDCHATAVCDEDGASCANPGGPCGTAGTCVGNGDGACNGAGDGTCQLSDSVGLYLGEAAHCSVDTATACSQIGVQDVCMQGETCVAPFGPGAALPVNPGDSPADLLVADLDGVNGPDLLVANFAADTLGAYLNDGGGGFTGPAAIPLEPEPAATQGPISVEGMESGTCSGGLNGGDRCSADFHCDATAHCDKTTTDQCFQIGVQDVCQMDEICLGDRNKACDPADLDADTPCGADADCSATATCDEDGASCNNPGGPCGTAGTCVGNGDGSCVGDCRIGVPRLVAAAHFDTDNYTVLRNQTLPGFPVDLPIDRIGSTAGLDDPEGIEGGQFNSSGKDDLMIRGPGAAADLGQLISGVDPDRLVRLAGFSLPVSGTSVTVTEDFNGDGITDLALAARNGEDKGGIQILLGSGQGEFQAGICSANSATPGLPCEPGSSFCTSGDCVELPFLALTGPGGPVPTALASGELNPVDNDLDGIPDSIDNCPSTFNPPEDCDTVPGTPDRQCDEDSDGIGDDCADDANPDPCRGTCESGNLDAGKTCDYNLDCSAMAHCEVATAIECFQIGVQDACPVGDTCVGDGDGSCVGVPADPDPDCDGDGINHSADNCPAVANAGQEDLDQNGIGDACDHHGVIDLLAVAGDGEVHPFLGRGDGRFEAARFPPFAGPDASVTGAVVAEFNSQDAEMDRFFDFLNDNCPTTFNPGQTDTDSDGFGDACDAGAVPDPCGGPGVDDCDADGFGLPADNCPAESNPLQEDAGTCAGGLNPGDPCFVDSHCHASATCVGVTTGPCTVIDGGQGDCPDLGDVCTGNGDGTCDGNGLGELCTIRGTDFLPPADAILAGAAGLTHYAGDGKARLLHPSGDLVRSCDAADLNSGDTCIGDFECDRTAGCRAGTCEGGFCTPGACVAGNLNEGTICQLDADCSATATCVGVTSGPCLVIDGGQGDCPDPGDVCTGNGDGDCQGNDLNAGESCLSDSQCDMTAHCSLTILTECFEVGVRDICQVGETCLGDGDGTCTGPNLNAGAICFADPVCDTGDLNAGAGCLVDNECHASATCVGVTTGPCTVIDGGQGDCPDPGDVCTGNADGACTGSCHQTRDCHPDDLNAGADCTDDSQCDASATCVGVTTGPCTVIDGGQGDCPDPGDVCTGNGDGACVGQGDGACTGGDLNAGESCTVDSDCHTAAECDPFDLNFGAPCTADSECHNSAHCSVTTSMACLTPGNQGLCPLGQTCIGNQDGDCSTSGNGLGSCVGNGDGGCAYDPAVSQLDPASTPVDFLRIGSFDLDHPVGLAVVPRGTCAAGDLNAGAGCRDDPDCDQAAPGDGLGTCEPPGRIHVLVLEKPTAGVFRESAVVPTSLPTAVISDLQVGDLNGDSLDDLAWTEANLDRLVVYLGAGGGEFFEAPGSPYAVGDDPSALAFLQVNDDNGDGVSDSLDQRDLAVAQRGSHNVVILRNRLSRRADLNGSGRVDGFDLSRLGRDFGLTYDRTSPPGGELPDSDLDLDGDVDGVDLALFTLRFGETLR